MNKNIITANSSRKSFNNRNFSRSVSPHFKEDLMPSKRRV